MVREFTNTRLAPCIRSPRRPARLVTRFGRHQENGRPIHGWPLLQSLDTTLAIPSRAEITDRPTERIDCAIYGGLYYGAFGHYLSETFLNLLAVRELKTRYPDRPILFHTPDFFRERTIDFLAEPKSVHAVEFERRLGFSTEGSILVNRPIEVGRLLVADAPFRRKFRYADWVPRALDELFGPVAGSTGPIYLSRTKWPRPRIQNEPEIEDLFASNGYEVVHLQDLDLSQQIDTVRSATHIAGPQGTALHWSLYSGTCRSVISMGWRSPLQRGICHARRQRYVTPPGKRVKGGELRVRSVSPVTVKAAISRVLETSG